LLASDGFTGAPAELIGPSDQWADLGRSWRCLEQYLKPYPVCRWAHPAVQAALELVSEHALTPDQIRDVEVTTFEAATRLSKHSPDTTEEAQYSLPFAVAAASCTGRSRPTTFSSPARTRTSGA
jgi:2-methylcitrate dehydratase PrpD